VANAQLRDLPAVEEGLHRWPLDVSDDYAGVVYRVSPPRPPTPGG
jgi:hypothetical protein